MRWFWNHYLTSEADKRNPLAAPLLADLRNLPPLLVTASEFDPLHDDSARLVARLEEAAAPHRYALWPGVTHGCIHMTRMLEVAQQAHRGGGPLGQVPTRQLSGNPRC